MTSAAIPSLAPLLEASPTILRLAIPRLAPIVATALAPEIAVPLIVIGTSYAAFQALYYWTKANNDAIQAKALQNYCTLNSSDPDCGVLLGVSFTGGQMPVSYSVNIQYTLKPNPYNIPTGYSNNIVKVWGPVSKISATAVEPIQDSMFGTLHDIEITCRGTVDAARKNSDVVVKLSGYGIFQDLTSASFTRVDGGVDTGGDRVVTPQSFTNLSSTKQQTALQQLTDDDWRSVIASTSARQLQEGETINQPVILSGNPNSAIPQERIPNVINFPGTVPAAAANDRIYIPANADGTLGFSIPVAQNIPNATTGESTRIQTPTGYIEVAPTGNLTIVGSPSAPLPTAAAPTNVGMPDIWKELQDIKQLIPLLPLAVGATIAPAITRVPSLSQVGSAVETGTCNIVSGKKSCNGNPLPSMNNKLDDVINGLGLGSQAIQGGFLQAIYNTVNTINSKMGSALEGGLSGGITRMSSFLGIDRLLSLLTTLAVLHNAAMLSSALKDTLLSMVSSVGQATGLLKDSEGNAVDTNALFNQGVEAFLKGLMGAEIYENAKLAFNRANRFYQASTNIVNEFRNIANGFQSIVERTGEYTGKIGNALKRFGLVGENAYSWMSENMNTETGWLSRLQERVSKTSEIISGVDDIAQNVISIQDSVKQLSTEKAEFNKALKDLVPTSSTDNTVVAAKVKLDKDASVAPNTTFADIP